MKINRCWLLAFALLILPGCGGRQEIRQTTIQMPTCEGKEDCELKWARAVQWITKNSSFRIRIMNDLLIETFPSAGNYNMYAAYRVSKVPLGQQRYRLELESGCGNLFGCGSGQGPSTVLPALSRYIQTGQ